MKASILIANYNSEDYLEECLNSIFNQTYENIEIIVFDDASTDNSVDRLKKFKNIELIINNKEKKKFGCFNQINSYKEAFRKSSGDIIFFLDSDDYFKNTKVEKILTEFKNNSNLNIIFDLPTFKFKNKEKTKKSNFNFFKTYWPFIPPQSCISIRKNNLEEVFSLLDINDFSDVWMDFRIGIISKYIYKQHYIFKNSFTYYRQSEQNISSKYKFLSKNGGEEDK